MLKNIDASQKLVKADYKNEINSVMKELSLSNNAPVYQLTEIDLTEFTSLP